jgi:hypothetical protein
MRAKSVIVVFSVIVASVGCTSNPRSAPGGDPRAIKDPVLQHHGDAIRSGVYIDPTLTVASIANLKLDTSFVTSYVGPVYAQPLYAERGDRDLVIVATEQAEVIAFDARDGSVAWRKSLGQPVSKDKLPCGNIDPLGITGTPIIDSNTLYVDAMTTPDAGATKKHLVFALNLDDGAVLRGWPVDVQAAATAQGLNFNPEVQNQRGALALLNGTLYVPYGGHFGDCGNYNGWIVGVKTSNPASVNFWKSRAKGAAIWAPGGIATDGKSLVFVTGNTFGTSVWRDGEAVIRLPPSLKFSDSTDDYFAPINWKQLDSGDIDLGGVGPILLNKIQGAPSVIVALGKDGMAYLVDPLHLGGVSVPIVMKRVTTDEIISAPAFFQSNGGAIIVFKGAGSTCPGGVSGDLTAIRISGAPPKLSPLWCASQNGMGSPIVTSPDGKSGFVVWGIGSEGDELLHAYDGLTGSSISIGAAGGQSLGSTARYNSPIAAKGRIFVASSNRLFAFSP